MMSNLSNRWLIWTSGLLSTQLCALRAVAASEERVATACLHCEVSGWQGNAWLVQGDPQARPGRSDKRGMPAKSSTEDAGHRKGKKTFFFFGS